MTLSYRCAHTRSPATRICCVRSIRLTGGGTRIIFALAVRNSARYRSSVLLPLSAEEEEREKKRRAHSRAANGCFHKPAVRGKRTTLCAACIHLLLVDTYVCVHTPLLPTPPRIRVFTEQTIHVCAIPPCSPMVVWGRREERDGQAE